MRNLLKSKAFWTLVSAIVAALSAFFLASCSAQAKVQRSGVHIDTVRVDYIIRSRNYTAQCLYNLSPIEFLLNSKSVSTALPLLFGDCSNAASLGDLKVNFCGSGFPIPLMMLNLSLSSSRSAIVASRIPIRRNSGCLLVNPILFSGSRQRTISGWSTPPLFAAILLSIPLSRGRRGGRRKGKPVKNIPLGGRHL